MTASSDAATRSQWDPGEDATPAVAKVADPVPTSSTISLPVYALRARPLERRARTPPISVDVPIARAQFQIGPLHSVIALVDSCSAVNLLSLNFIESLPSIWKQRYQKGSDKARQTTLVGFDGIASAHPNGHITLPIQISSSSPPDIDFYISDRAGHPVLLGTPAIKALQLVIDLHGRKITCKQTSASIPLQTTQEPHPLPWATTSSSVEPFEVHSINSIVSGSPSEEDCVQDPRLEHLTKEQWEQHVDEIMTATNLKLTDCSPEELNRLAQLIAKNAHLFSSSIVPMGVTNTVQHHIELTELHPPHREPLRRMGPGKEQVSRDKLNQLLKDNVVEPSRSPWAAAVVITPKKSPGQWRFAIDYRRLNDVTKFDAYPMPRVDNGLELLNGATHFTSLDLASGFHQVRIDDASKELTAFLTPEGLFQFTRMPFGLKCAPATFQRLMDIVLAGLTWRSCMVYLDDILIFTSGTFNAHLDAIQKVLDRLHEHGLRALPSKCAFVRSSLVYLGHIIDRTGMRPDSRLVEAVTTFPTPKSVANVRSFLGLSGYYRVYIDHFAELAAPLTELLRKNVVFHWGSAQDEAFRSLRDRLAGAPVLHYPDFAKPFFVKTDYSHLALGAILTQFDNDHNEYPVAYLSRRCQGKESTYSARRGEAVALWWSVKRWRPYLEGIEFTVISDHLSLAFLRKPQDDVKLQRVVNELEHFTFRVVYKKGADHVDADALSRCHPETCCQEDSDIVDDDEHIFDHILSIDTAAAETNSPPNELLEINPEALRKAQLLEPNLFEIPGTNVDTAGILRRENPTNNKQCIVVPTPFRRQFLHLAHTSRSAGHFGQRRTQQLMANFAFWPNMVTDIAEFCRGCLICQAAKLRKPDRAGLMVHRTTSILPAWSVIYTDHYGPLNRSERGAFRFVLTVVCASSRSVRFIPVKNTSALETARALMNLFASESYPIRFHSDRGSAFCSKLISELSKIVGFELRTTVAYRPKGNALVERPHSFLRTALIAMGNSEQTDWPDLLGLVSLSYRSCVHPALGEIPFFLERGRDPRLAQELAVATVHEYPVELQQWRSTMQHRMSQARRLAAENDKRLIKKNADAYNKNRQVVSYQPTQLVWIWREPPASTQVDPTRRTRKLCARAGGPYRVVEKLAHNNYRLRHVHTGEMDTFNVDTMVPVLVTEWSDPTDLVVPYAESREDTVFDDPYDTADTGSDEDYAGNSVSRSHPKKGGYSAPRAPTSLRSLRPVPDRLARAASARALQKESSGDSPDPTGMTHQTPIATPSIATILYP